MSYDDPHYELAMALNAAANGRVLCVLLCVINLVVGDVLMATMAALCLGAAYLSECMPTWRSRVFMGGCVVLMTAGVAAATLYNVW
jgi:hypothetical protein